MPAIVPKPATPTNVSTSVEEAVAYVLQGRDQRQASRAHTFSLLAAHCGVRKTLSLSDEERAGFLATHKEVNTVSPVLKITGVRTVAGNRTGLLHDCHVTLVRPHGCRLPPSRHTRTHLTVVHLVWLLSA